MNVIRIRSVVMVIPLVTSTLSVALGAAGEVYQMKWKNSGFLNQRRDFATGIVLDSNDALYVAGESGRIYGTGGNGSSVALVAKYNPANGQQAWLSQAYDSLQLDHPSGMAIDAANNIFVAGETYRYAGAEAFLVKFAQNGTRLWESHIGSSDNEFGSDVAVDTLGNAYMSGSTTGDLGVGSNGQGYDGFIVKYSPSGSRLQTLQLRDSIGDFADTISLDPDGSMYVAGSRGIGTYLAKLDADGDLIWRLTPNYSTTVERNTQLYESMSDPAGNLYVVGATNSLYDNARGFLERDAAVAKYDPDGNLLWQKHFSLRTLDVLTSVAVDSVGNVYVAGLTMDTPFGISGAANSMWAKYDSLGNQLWLQEFGTSERDSAHGIAIDSAGHVFVTGSVVRNVNQYVDGDADTYVARFDVVPEPTAMFLLTFGCLFSGAICRRRYRR